MLTLNIDVSTVSSEAKEVFVSRLIQEVDGTITTLSAEQIVRVSCGSVTNIMKAAMIAHDFVEGIGR